MNFEVDNSTRIVCIDRDNNWVAGLSIILSEQFPYKIISRFDHLEDVIKNIKLLNPHIILVNASEIEDYNMHAIKKIKFETESIQILPFAQSPSNELIVKCISYGASGFLIGIKKNYKELILGLDKIHKGIPPLSKGASLALVNHFRGLSNSSLTSKEAEVILQMKEGKSAAEVASSLNMAKDTARKHMANIYRKLDVNNRAQAFEKLFF